MFETAVALGVIYAVTKRSSPWNENPFVYNLGYALHRVALSMSLHELGLSRSTRGVLLNPKHLQLRRQLRSHAGFALLMFRPANVWLRNNPPLSKGFEPCYCSSRM